MYPETSNCTYVAPAAIASSTRLRRTPTRKDAVGNDTFTTRSVSPRTKAASRAAGLSILVTRPLMATGPSCSTMLPSSPRNCNEL